MLMVMVEQVVLLDESLTHCTIKMFDVHFTNWNCPFQPSELTWIL